MGRNQIPRSFAENAGASTPQDSCASSSDEFTAASATWIPAPPADGEQPQPIASDLLAELDLRISALTSQLEVHAELAASPATAEPRNIAAAKTAGASSRHRPDDASDLAYLLDQFRVLTFTTCGTMNRQTFRDAQGVPVGQLQALLDRFVALSQRLSEIVRQTDPDSEVVWEIQRQTRSVSQKVALVQRRLSSRQTGDFMDELAALLQHLSTIAELSGARDTELDPLCQRLGETLAQFEDGVQQTRQHARYTERFQRVAQEGTRSLDRLLARRNCPHHATLLRLQIRLSFAAAQFAIRSNNSAMPPRSVPSL